ncbi:hypothetical protein [Variovorax boronicumulans]
MTMNLLKHLASSRLPQSITSPEDIDKVRILRAAGLVIAFVPAPSNPLTLSGPERATQVLTITQKGREELLRFHASHGKSPDADRMHAPETFR